MASCVSRCGMIAVCNDMQVLHRDSTATKCTGHRCGEKTDGGFLDLGPLPLGIGDRFLRRNVEAILGAEALEILPVNLLTQTNDILGRVGRREA